MFIVQPTSRFLDRLREELDWEEGGQRQWRSFEFAVAWVNARGAEAIQESARGFLAEGERIRATVGLDFGSTTYEGLVQLLDIEDTGGDMTTHVYFDENRACTFHPKVFLFSNAERARLLVGSNNLTGAGLWTNVEATLRFDGAPDLETIQAAKRALEGWRHEESDPRTRRLTRDLLELLLERRYVLTEEELRDQRRREGGSGEEKREPLFGRSQTSALPAMPGTTDQDGRGERATSVASGEALLMRVRPRRNGKQVQISMRVLEGDFMRDAGEIYAADGSRREIGYNVARRVRNTARFEAPEMEGMTNPVARFRWLERTGSERFLRFEVFDAATGGIGDEIFRKLEDGIELSPRTDLEDLSHDHTVLSKPQRDSAQWYRLDDD